jgi:hypothetical protein
MIDTDKYEGHTRGPWTIDINKVGDDTSAIVIESSNCVVAEVEVENKYAEADAQLIADAPLLLEEVKRLRKVLQDIRTDALVMMANGVENAHSIVLQAERGEDE